MISFRRGVTILFAIIAGASSSVAQEEFTAPDTGAPTSTTGSGTGAGATPGTGTGTSSGGSAFGIGSIFNPGPSNSAVDTIAPPTGGAATGTGGFQGGNAGSSSGGGTVGSSSSNVAPVMVNSGYGSAPQSFEPGKGRFARSPLRFTLSLSQGFDDNVFSASRNKPEPAPLPLVEPEAPPAAAGAMDPATGQPVTAPEAPPAPRPAEEEETPEPLGRQGSAFSQADVGVQWQFTTPRNAATFDAVIGGSYYWDRPGDPYDYHGLTNLLYVHRLSPRMQLSTQLHAVYQSQPNFGLVNGPTRQSLGNYLVANARFDLSYQLTGRFQSVTSYTASTINYENAELKSSNYLDNLVGQQVRYLVSPRATAIGEYRFSLTSYDDAARSYSTHYLLAGLDFSLSRRFITTLRLGESIQSYEEGDSSSTPYGESTLTYGFAQRSTVIWSNRYGFEDSGSVTSRRTSYRTSLTVNHGFTPKLSLALSLYYNHYATEMEGAQEEIKEDAIDGSLTLRYVVKSNFSINLNYTHTEVLSSLPTNEYDRNRYSLGVEYSF